MKSISIIQGIIIKMLDQGFRQAQLNICSGMWIIENTELTNGAKCAKTFNCFKYMVKQNLLPTYSYAALQYIVGIKLTAIFSMY